jgi:hypothetical protein
MRYFSREDAAKRVAAGKPVYADYFSKLSGKQVRIRVVMFRRRKLDSDFQLLSIDNEWSEWLDKSRVSFSDG